MIRTVAGRYEIAAQIGQGGLCDVYRAHDTLLDRTVAVKLLRPELRGDAGAVARFEHGARIGATFTHRSLGHVFDAGSDPAVGPFFIQEYLPGQQLDALLPAVPTNALRWSAQIAEALALLHQHGLVHRAVAPEHIRITPDGRAVLFDFGMVGRSGAAAQPVFGASYYGAPDGAGGAPTPAADVYALGVALHEMLTGAIPLPRQPGQADQERSGPTLPPLRERLPAMVSTVEGLLERATAPDPASRPSMAELAAELNALLVIAGGETAVIAPATRRLTLTLPEILPESSPAEVDGHESPTVTVAPLPREHRIDPQTLPTEVITPPSGIEARPPGSR
ncbi:MAG TPA: serine/threonine-protein kinase, partial [Herpetosiphonaceae bacterium]